LQKEKLKGKKNLNSGCPRRRVEGPGQIKRKTSNKKRAIHRGGGKDQPLTEVVEYRGECGPNQVRRVFYRQEEKG